MSKSKSKSKNDARMSLRLPKELKEKLKSQCGETPPALIRRLLEEHLKRK